MRIPGPAVVKVGSSANLANTLSGVQIRFQDSWRPIYVDRFGQLPFDYIYTGSIGQIIFESFDEALYDQLNALSPDSPFGSGSPLEDVGNIIDHSAAAGHFTTKITEGDGSSVWEATNCFWPLNWRFRLTSTAPIVFAAQINVLRNDDKKFFSTVPSYIRSTT